MPTNNKEVLRIRALPTYTYHVIHASNEPIGNFRARIKTWEAGGKKGPPPKRHEADIYRCAPIDFKAERTVRKERWAALRMWEGRKSAKSIL